MSLSIGERKGDECRFIAMLVRPAKTCDAPSFVHSYKQGRRQQTYLWQGLPPAPMHTCCPAGCTKHKTCPVPATDWTDNSQKNLCHESSVACTISVSHPEHSCSTWNSADKSAIHHWSQGGPSRGAASASAASRTALAALRVRTLSIRSRAAPSRPPLTGCSHI